MKGLKNRFIGVIRVCIASALAPTTLILVWSTSLFAYEVSPLVLDLDSDGPASIAQIEIRNTLDRAIALELNVLERVIDSNSSNETALAEGNFMLTPPQVFLERGVSVSVSLKWTGPEDINQTIPYYIQVSQLPIDLEPQQKVQGVQFVTNFFIAVYVSPPGADAEVVIDSVVKSDASAKVVLKNKGRRYARLSDLKVKMFDTKSGFERIFSALSGIAQGENGQNGLIMAGQQRELDFDIPSFSQIEGLEVIVLSNN